MLYRMSYCSLSPHPAAQVRLRGLLMVSCFDKRRDHVKGKPQDQADPERALQA